MDGITLKEKAIEENNEKYFKLASKLIAKEMVNIKNIKGIAEKNVGQALQHLEDIENKISNHEPISNYSVRTNEGEEVHFLTNED